MFDMSKSAPASKGKTVDVVVIGAGLAGLAAARRLNQGGASTVVLEARNRVGGRIKSERVSTGHMIDLGAQFAGADHWLVAALADEAGLARTSAEVPGDILFMDERDAGPQRRAATDLPLGLLQQLDLFQANWRIERAIAQSEGAGRIDLDRIDAAAFIRAKTFGTAAYKAMSSYIEGELCTPLERMSALEMLEQGRSIGGLAGEGTSAQWYFAGGAAAMAEHLASQVSDSLCLNAPVSAVIPDPAGVTIKAATGVYRASSAIVAVPPQLYGAVGVFPHLPTPWQRAIAGWNPGSVVKTILVFASPWWRGRGLSGMVVSPGATFGAVVDVSPSDASVGILVLFATARGGEVLGRVPTEAGRIAQAMQWLRRVHGRDVPEPRAARSADWSADPFSLGGYAGRRGVGAWTDAPDLFAPLGRLHFAGTETATRWRSFMEGALDSGIQAAEAILGKAATAGTPAARAVAG